MREAGVDPGALRCNRKNAFGSTLKGDARAGADQLLAALSPSLKVLSEAERAQAEKTARTLLFWRMVRAVIIEGDNNNFGVVPLDGYSFRDAAGRRRPVLIFRTGFTPHPDAPGSCFRSLLSAGGVRHVVNLFDGAIPSDDLVAAESRAAASAGATYESVTDEKDGRAAYGPWRDLLRKRYDDPASREAASRAVARLIREQVLRPDGAPPRGNLQIHCGGGMHRTGMIVGVIERCIDHAPMDVVERHYKEHVGWRDAAHPGGFEPGNLRFIREFDCGRLSAKDAGVSR